MSDIDQLVTLSGMVIRTSSIVPEMREAYFRCAVCGAAATAELERGRVPEPAHCSHCNTAHSYQLIHNRSHFSDKQLVKLQESPGNIPYFCNYPHYVIFLFFVIVVMCINIILEESFIASCLQQALLKNEIIFTKYKLG